MIVISKLSQPSATVADILDSMELLSFIIACQVLGKGKFS